MFGSSYCVVEAPHHTVLTMPGMKAMKKAVKILKAMKVMKTVKKAMKAMKTPAMKAMIQKFNKPLPAQPEMTAEQILLMSFKSHRRLEWLVEQTMLLIKKAMKPKAAAMKQKQKAMKILK